MRNEIVKRFDIMKFKVKTCYYDERYEFPITILFNRIEYSYTFKCIYVKNKADTIEKIRDFDGETQEEKEARLGAFQYCCLKVEREMPELLI
jgi:hypothetical protein